MIDFINSDETIFEQGPLESLAMKNELIAYKHHNFWGCMDTLRDKKLLTQLWNNNKAPWKIW